ncbi:hypothetical protein [Fulvivirga ligni]|uniref:hypothetical protein n=1 Tax=Fulvivirga ligni TaxID=2904246 RepID=UPI001F19F3B4|nr:hypothetical protein [Fulvivirga ligni]UII20297.1 hypothetical protein LVD16_20860 [Fulvivirga ligni]
MKAQRINVLLGYIQIFAIILQMIIISNYSLKQGGIAVFFILFGTLLLLPFLLFAIGSVINRKYQRSISIMLWMSVVILFAPSLLLPYFYEWGGFIITLVAASLSIMMLILKGRLEIQLLTFNIVGISLFCFISCVIVSEISA